MTDIKQNISSNDSSLPELNYLYKAMEGKTATSGWDIITSYSIEELNKVLKAQYDEKKIIDVVEVNTKIMDPLTEEEKDLNVKLELGSPLLHFIASESKKCKLIMPIESGTYKIEDSQTKELPKETYEVICTVPIVALSGTTGEILPSNEPIFFSKCNENQVNHIILHIKSKNCLFEIKPKEGKSTPKDDLMRICIAPLLSNYFSKNIKEIGYELTSLKNEKPNNDIMLQPQSFVFSASGKDKDGVLSLYISTVGSNNQDGDREPIFKYNNESLQLIPKDHTTSIIFSRELISQKYIIEQLKKGGAGIEEVQTSSGLLFKICVDKQIIKHSEGDSFWNTFSIDDIDISLKQNPIELEIRDGNIMINWSYNKILGWERDIYTPGTGNVDMWGRFELDIILKKTIPFTIEDTNISAKIYISPNDYKIKTKAQSLNFFEKINHGVETLPKELYYKNFHIDFPSIELNLGSFGFFHITNLLFPGQHIIDIDKSVGIKIPFDLMLVGNFVKGLARQYKYESSKEKIRIKFQGNKDTQTFINDALTDEKKAAKLFEILANGHSCDLYDWLEKNDYEVSADELKQYLDNVISNKTNVNSRGVGTVSDMKIWAGKYKVNTPQKLKGKILSIDSKNEKATFDEKNINILFTSKNEAWWQLEDEIYHVKFIVDDKDKGDEIEVTFEGNITKEHDETEVVSFTGSRYEDDSDEWYNKDSIILICSLVGAIAFVSSISLLAQNIIKNNKIKETQKKVTDYINETFTESPYTDIEIMEVIEPQINKEIRRLITESIQKRSYLDASNNDWERFLGEEVMLETSKEFKEKYEAIISTAIEAKASEMFGSDYRYMCNKTFERQIKDKYMDKNYRELTNGYTANSYYNEIGKLAYYDFRMEKIIEQEQKIEKRINEIEGQLKDSHQYIEENLTEYKRVSEKYENKVELTDAEEKLRKDVKNKMQEQKKLEKGKSDAQKELESKKQTKKDVEIERRKTRVKAEDLRKKVFKI